MSEALKTTAAHLDAVRRRGRHLMARESDTGVPAEVFHSASAARDGLILMLSLWMVLLGAGRRELGTGVVLAAAISFGIYCGVANCLAVAAQLRHWRAELRRERNEIREQPEQERDEVRALYEAKGFSGEMLDRIVDTLCADEDRLLKIMLEEELGIFFEQAHHPVAMGLLTGSAALLGGVTVALAGAVGPAWLPLAIVAVMLALISIMRTGGAWRAAVPSFARWTLTAGTLAGVAYHLAELLLRVS